MSDIALHMRALGVSYGASPSEVKSAWREAVKKFHPDVAGADTTEEMVRINAAYEALKAGSPAKPKPQEKPVSSKRATASSLYPFPIILRRYNVSAEIRQSWQEAANEILDKAGVPRPNAGFFKKVLRRTPNHKVFLPERFVTSGDKLLIKFRGGFPKGKVRLILPRFSVQDQTLHMASLHEVDLFDFVSHCRNNITTGARLPELDGFILPHLNLKILISAY